MNFQEQNFEEEERTLEEEKEDHGIIIGTEIEEKYYSDNKEEIGNLLFLEAAGDDHGKATYVFRLMDWVSMRGQRTFQFYML